MIRMNKASPGLKISDFEDRSLLIVDDDDPLRDRLSRAMERKGFQVKNAKTGMTHNGGGILGLDAAAMALHIFKS